MQTIYPSVFKKPEVVNELRRLHDNFVLVPADNASNNIVFVKISILGIPLILEPILQGMKFFKIIFLS
jgi:hypothetical protein